MSRSSIWSENWRRKDESEIEWLLRALLQNLQCLATDAETLIKAYPPGIPVANDLVNDFDTHISQAQRCVDDGLITMEAMNSIKSVLAEISRMTERRDPSLWTNEALHSRGEWASVRHIAREALEVLGYDLEPPPPWSGTTTQAKV